jgi:hypothetical protein
VITGMCFFLLYTWDFIQSWFNPRCTTSQDGKLRIINYKSDTLVHLHHSISVVCYVFAYSPVEGFFNGRTRWFGYSILFQRNHSKMRWSFIMAFDVSFDYDRNEIRISWWRHKYFYGTSLEDTRKDRFSQVVHPFW